MPMSEQAISAVLGSNSAMMPAQAMGTVPGSQNPATPGLPGGFSQILHSQNAASAALETLRPVLSPEMFSQLQLQVKNGNLLPLAEIVAAITTPQQLANAGAADPAMQQAGAQQPLAQIVAAMQSKQSSGGYIVVSKEGEAISEGELDAGEDAELPLSEIASALRLQFEPVDSGVKPGQEVLHPLVGMVVSQVLEKPRDTGAASPAMPTALHANKELLGVGNVNKGQGAVAPELVSDPDVDAALEYSEEAMKQSQASEQSKSMGASNMGQGLQTASANAALRSALGGLEAGGIQPNPTTAGASSLSPGQQPLNPLPTQAGNPVSATAPQIDLHLGQKGWAQAMGDRVLWMIGNRLQGAEVRITPQNLGPIDIRVSINNDQASVSFAAHHGVVREALEAGIPRLREMLGESNLQLVNVDVGQRDANSQRMPSDFFGDNRFSSHGEGEFGEGEGGELEGGDEPVRYYRQDALLDDFA